MFEVTGKAISNQIHHLHCLFLAVPVSCLTMFESSRPFKRLLHPVPLHHHPAHYFILQCCRPGIPYTPIAFPSVSPITACSPLSPSFSFAVNTFPPAASTLSRTSCTSSTQSVISAAVCLPSPLAFPPSPSELLLVEEEEEPQLMEGVKIFSPTRAMSKIIYIER